MLLFSPILRESFFFETKNSFYIILPLCYGTKQGNKYRLWYQTREPRISFPSSPNARTFPYFSSVPNMLNCGLLFVYLQIFNSLQFSTINFGHAWEEFMIFRCLLDELWTKYKFQTDFGHYLLNRDINNISFFLLSNDIIWKIEIEFFRKKKRTMGLVPI